MPRRGFNRHCGVLENSAQLRCLELMLCDEVAADRLSYARQHVCCSSARRISLKAADAANDAAYVADHWTSPDRDEAMELWNLVPAGKRPAQGPAEIAERHDVSRAEGM